MQHVQKLLVICLLSQISLIANANVDANSFKNFYLGMQLGYSTTHYTNATLSEGITAESIKQSGLGERLYGGYTFNSYFYSELGIIYFRHPEFYNLNNQATLNRITHNLISLLGRVNWPLHSNSRFNLNIKGGVGYIARSGINYSNTSALSKGNYVTPVYGFGVSYDMTKSWIIDAAWMQAPAQSNQQLPASNFFGLGIFYKFGMHPTAI